ncbi:MAG TPA: CHAT domain-containing protein [Candidatus Deferrimicrobium sp.]|nr:CHAT domain-containing protein [Candidatus Deferrimicrobium sp.]
MPVIYNVNIEPLEKENVFQVTWHNVENNVQDCFAIEADITPQETRWLWQEPNNQAVIGEKLFRFLDGDARHLARALQEAHLQGEMLQIYLWACKQTSDWPFELLFKDDIFLLTNRIHLIRCVSDWGKGKRLPPQNRQLKFLFMACSALDVKSELDYEWEEDAIFKATEKLPIDMEVEDSGSLEGLRDRLENEQYDVVHLSGHADIAAAECPFFIMENELGCRHDVFPEKLWQEALMENPPRLLFLSGCRTGETPDSDKNTDAVSFAHLLVKNYHVPAVLGWGRNVNDLQAIHAEKVLFHELSRGKSILEAVLRVRCELHQNFPNVKRKAWPLLRLFSGGVTLDAIVQKSQRWQPKPKLMQNVYLKTSTVKVLIDGFIGRRRQIQRISRSLKQDVDKVGTLIMGTGGLGKSCLAAKICERFKDHTAIIVHGKINPLSLGAALKDAFTRSQDEKGKSILAQPGEMTDKLARLCAASFKEQGYLILLDGFDQNIEGAEKGRPGPLTPEAAELLKVLLHYLPFSGKMTQLIVTSRYGFSLTEQNRDLVGERLERVTLTSFQETEQLKKLWQLENFLNYKYGVPALELIKEGKGNPLLMEILDELIAGNSSLEEPQLLEALRGKREEFIRGQVLRELMQYGGPDLEKFLSGFSGYSQPVQEQDIVNMADKAGLKNWQILLEKGIRLSLIEHDQARQSYQVTPLLREEFQLK